MAVKRLALRDTRVAPKCYIAFSEILRSRLATLQLRVGESCAYQLTASPTRSSGAVDRKRPGSPGAKKGGNSSLGERNFRISVAGTELSHRRESSFPSRSSVSLATPLINSRTGGGRKGFPYLRQRFWLAQLPTGFLRGTYAASLSPRTRLFFFFFFSSFSFDNSQTYALAYCARERAQARFTRLALSLSAK